MHVQIRDCVLDRAHDGGVVVAVERGMDSTLQADLGRTALPRLDGPPDDLRVRDEVRGAAQIGGELSFRERTEPAAEIADVRVLHVARDHVGDDVAVPLAPERVGAGQHPLALLPARVEEAHDLVLAELVGGVDRQRIASHDERHGLGRAGRPLVLAREPLRVREPEHARQYRRIDPRRVDETRIRR